MDATGYGAAAGGLLGLGKGIFVDVPQARRDRALAATTQRLSPWTGLRAQPVKEADVLGDAMQGAVGGASFGQSMQNFQADQGLKSAQTDWLNRGGGGIAGPGPRMWGAQASPSVGADIPRTASGAPDFGVSSFKGGPDAPDWTAYSGPPQSAGAVPVATAAGAQHNSWSDNSQWVQQPDGTWAQKSAYATPTLGSHGGTY